VPADTTVVVSAVDENTAELVRFCSSLPPPHRRDATFREVELTVDHVLSSAAVPLLFPPGHAGGRHGLVDAGLVANTPLAPVLHYEPDRVIVVSAPSGGRPAETPDSLGAAIALLADNVTHFALASDLAHARTANLLARVAPDATPKRDVPILVIEPADLGFSVDRFLDFRPAQAREVIEQGREQTAKALVGWPV
jgi:NTE family protein